VQEARKSTNDEKAGEELKPQNQGSEDPRRRSLRVSPGFAPGGQSGVILPRDFDA